MMTSQFRNLRDVSTAVELSAYSFKTLTTLSIPNTTELCHGLLVVLIQILSLFLQQANLSASVSVSPLPLLSIQTLSTCQTHTVPLS